MINDTCMVNHSTNAFRIMGGFFFLPNWHKYLNKQKIKSQICPYFIFIFSFAESYVPLHLGPYHSKYDLDHLAQVLRMSMKNHINAPRYLSSTCWHSPLGSNLDVTRYLVKSRISTPLSQIQRSTGTYVFDVNSDSSSEMEKMYNDQREHQCSTSNLL